MYISFSGFENLDLNLVKSGNLESARDFLNFFFLSEILNKGKSRAVM